MASTPYSYFMHSDIFASSIVVFILGEHSVCKHIGVKLTKTFVRTKYIDVKNISGDVNRANTFKQRIVQRYYRGNRMFVLTGYPQTVGEALLIKDLFPHQITFSVEKERTPHGVLQEIKRRLAEKGQIHLVRQNGNPVQFIKNRIEAFLISNKLAHAASSLVKTRVLSAA